MTLSNLDILFCNNTKLSDTLMWRRVCNVGLESLVVRSCCVDRDRDRIRFEELVKDVTWEDVRVMGSDNDGTETESDEEADEDEDLDFW